jgi:hypothetical protein
MSRCYVGCAPAWQRQAEVGMQARTSCITPAHVLGTCGAVASGRECRPLPVLYSGGERNGKEDTENSLTGTQCARLVHRPFRNLPSTSTVESANACFLYPLLARQCPWLNSVSVPSRKFLLKDGSGPAQMNEHVLYTILSVLTHRGREKGWDVSAAACLAAACLATCTQVRVIM